MASSKTPGQAPVEFVTMGMFILDDIDFEGPQPNVKNVLGGAASFAVVGARLVTGKKDAQAVSWIVDVGSDFPQEVLDLLKSWDTDCVFREDQNRLTTRAWNGYGPNEKRDFEYLTPKLRLEPSMLSERQVFSKTVHMVCSASRCISIVEEIMHRREQLRQDDKAPPGVDSSERPFFIWEPVPNLCTPEEQDKFFAANKVVDVVSPNELELGMMFGQPGWSEESEFGRDIVKRILDFGIGPQGEGLLSIRAGKDGSYSYTGSQRVWLPAYHQPGSSGTTKVVDPTGAGNSYLGALAQGMVSAGRDPAKVIESTLAGSEDWRKATQDWGKQNHYLPALIFATVAASFVVEQIGVPRLSTISDGAKELWNETEFTERVRLYTERLYRTLEESPQRHLRGQLTN